MTSELYLVAHRVRGLPAFDIAAHLECPECLSLGCPECDDLGYWWIVPTSGHRAYPYWNIQLDAIEFEGNGNYCLSEELATMPPSLPDHYPHRAAPTVSLAEALGIRPAPLAPIVRRF